MMKKAISILMICVMLFTISPVVAADDVSAQPTVEEILNAYHQKAFEAEASGEADTVSTYSLRSRTATKTLEQETVETLNDAGYEAYNITADNYDTLSAELQTDFTSMGLDPDGSYIVVISGEESSEDSGVAPAASDLFLPPHVDNGGSSSDSSFYYTYNGKEYRLRYLTVTAASDPDYAVDSAYHIVNNDTGITFAGVLGNLLDEVIYVAADSITEAIPFGTIASICGLSVSNFLFTDQRALKSLAINGGSSWNRIFTQVYVESTSEWVSYLYVEYVTAVTYMSGLYYDSTLGYHTEVPQQKAIERIYSPHYSDTTWRKETAIQKYLQGLPGSFYYDRTGDVKYIYDGKVVIRHSDTVG